MQDHGYARSATVLGFGVRSWCDAEVGQKLAPPERSLE